jgi:hypothetical protein
MIITLTGLDLYQGIPHQLLWYKVVLLWNLNGEKCIEFEPQ